MLTKHGLISDIQSQDNQKFFTPDLVKLARKRGLALLDTRELFKIVCAKLEGKPIPLDNICEDLSTDGEVRFRL